MSKQLPLEGIRVADLTMVWAGPYATRLLGDMGAEVIKIESVQVWDQLRGLGSLPPETERRYNKSAYFNHNNRNKYGATLNLRHPRGKELFLELVKQCDVVMENYRAEVMDRLGLHYEALRTVNPDIIMVSMPGHGKTGPERDYVAYGTNVEQLAGVVSLTGYEGEQPQKTGISFGDPMAGTAAAGAVALALHYRNRTGRGQYIDLAQREALSAFVGEQMVGYSMSQETPGPRGNKHPFHAPHGVYPCQSRDEEDDPWVAIACESDAQFVALCAVIGEADLATDPRFATEADRYRNQETLAAPIAAWTQGRDKMAAMEELQAAGVPAGAVLSVQDLTASPQLRARGFWESVSDPDAGTWEMEGPAWVLTSNPAHVRLPAPNFGEHNQYVFGELLGQSAAELAALEAAGVIGTEPDMGRHT
jgi:crotonobetainyl-CoA:carnitine CoA-transferase CaiB-like acyl-CoA transferase